MTNYSYIGSELELFSEAWNWKAYYRGIIKNYIGSEVLEVGAGIGSTTKLLCKKNQKRWVCLEPDPNLADKILSLISSGSLPECCEQRVGTLLDISNQETFDTIIYIDVLEHIEDDQTEVEIAASRLKNGGNLVILAPAHQWLFTPFDETIGHYRRYNKKMLSTIIPKNLECIDLIYLDCVGLIASLSNRFILKSKMPSRKQIAFWDEIMIPVSRLIDPLIQFSIGKSVVGIWQKSSK